MKICRFPIGTIDYAYLCFFLIGVCVYLYKAGITYLFPEIVGSLQKQIFYFVMDCVILFQFKINNCNFLIFPFSRIRLLAGPDLTSLNILFRVERIRRDIRCIGLFFLNLNCYGFVVISEISIYKFMILYGI